MMHRLFRAAAALLVALAFALPAAAQLPGPPGQEEAKTAPATPEPPGRPNTMPAYVAAFLGSVLVLFIICKPARKT